jgi:hypothetical protein
MGTTSESHLKGLLVPSALPRARLGRVTAKPLDTLRNRQRNFAVWALLVGVLILPGTLPAQSLDARGGTSTFLDTSGFLLDYRWAPLNGWVGIGCNQGTHAGGFVGTTYRGTD